MKHPAEPILPPEPEVPICCEYNERKAEVCGRPALFLVTIRPPHDEPVKVWKCSRHIRAYRRMDGQLVVIEAH